MQFPILKAGAFSRHTLDVFRGYHNASRIAEGELSHMENLTSDHYPVLAPRAGRQEFAQGSALGGMIAKDCLCWVDGSAFVMGEYAVELGLTPGQKQLVSMGAYVVIFPDKKYINTMDLTDFGSLEAVFETDSQVTVSLCDSEGSPLTAAAQPTAPESGLWLDTTQKPAVLRRQDAATGAWTDLAETYIRLDCPGIGRSFQALDGVTVTGLPEEGLDGGNVIWVAEEDYVVLTGLVEATGTVEGLTLRRSVPEMDFVTCAGNRLWGCRYGLNADGQPVNEIYASKLGDFRNWSCFMGISTDSYALSLGDDGAFTGAACFRGQPVFFREDRLHRIYGTAPASFQLLTTEGAGVEKGSDRSIALVGQSLFYKAPGGICAYDGSVPVAVSQKLGLTPYTAALGGCLGQKYYVSMEDRAGRSLFVYDTVKKLWHREADPGFRGFCPCRDTLYAHTDTRIFDLTAGEERVEWFAQTGPLELGAADRQYNSRLTVSMELGEGSEVRIYARCDGGAWELLLRRVAPRRQTVSVPMRPRRCRTLELRLEGSGEAKLFSLTRTLEKGSELS